MATLASILSVIGPLLSQLSSIITNAIVANATKDQATLDALHVQALAIADALKPAGA